MTSEEAILAERNHLRAKLASLTKERDDDFAVMTARALASEERAARFERILRATAAGLMGLDDGRTYEGDALLEYMPAEALGQHKAWLAAEGRLTAAIAREANFAGVAAQERAEKRAALWKRLAKALHADLVHTLADNLYGQRKRIAVSRSAQMAYRLRLAEAVIAASRAMLAVDPWRGRGAEWEQMRSALAALDAEAGR